MAVTKQDTRFAMCRAMGHSWHHNKPVGSDDDSGFRAPFGGLTGMIGYPSTCGNCGTRRMRWITRSGESFVRYLHPEGYAKHGEERLSPVEWRRQFVATVFDSFAQAS